MPNNSKELQDILYRILRILLSTQVTLWVVWRQIQRGYALFLYNAKLVRQMPNNNKQATKAKNSNLSAIDIVIVISTIVISILLHIFAPSVLMAIAKFIGCLALVAMAVVPMLLALNVFYNER